MMARLGGDEFAVLLSDRINSAGLAVGAGERFRRLCDQPFVVGGRQLTVTVGVGISRGGDRGETATDLLRQADVALYRAKRLGRDRSESLADVIGLDVARLGDPGGRNRSRSTTSQRSMKVWPTKPCLPEQRLNNVATTSQVALESQRRTTSVAS
jgi:Diguanylate cyclase, GGDEF domain